MIWIFTPRVCFDGLVRGGEDCGQFVRFLQETGHAIRRHYFTFDNQFHPIRRFVRLFENDTDLVAEIASSVSSFPLS
jgi:hypothetical protein